MEKAKLDLEAYLEQFHNHHHHQKESINRRKWYEPIGTKTQEPKILDKFKK